MAKYLDAVSAAADGYTIEHDQRGHRFTINHEDRVLGEAHYSLRTDGSIDFDHTLVDPSLRGTGLSGVLAQLALSDDVAQGRTIHASCWFIAGYLEKHPELRGSSAAQ